MHKYLHSMIQKRTDDEIDDVRQRLNIISCKDAMDGWYYRKLMTKVAADLIASSKCEDKIPDIAKQKMLARAAREARKDFNTDMKKLEDAEEVEPPTEFEIDIEWKRGSYGTMNPTATVNAMYEAVVRDERGVPIRKAMGQSTSGKATGSGYDKESAAAASAMNKNKFIMRLLYDHAESGGKFEYGVSDTSRGYLPHLDGGVGMTAFIAVFNALGYECSHRSGKYFDFYKFRRRENAHEVTR